ncbi:MAG: T9SS type A sorting domain-containing protein [Lewinellaceae bacterium]|nr:T9SS type A sorting domain-containing protein [Saprospiraceae bacterium]MCB9331553.1 T9SS type A sorting domain-containing protein [Lewinellaceae bacterium]
MFKHIIFYTILLCCSAMLTPALAQQQDVQCNAVDQPITQGQVFFDYGGVTDAFSIRNRSSHSVGQTVVGNIISQSHISQQGFWAIYQIPPLRPIVHATQGELLDRIQVSWTVDPLSAPPTEGFKLYRDGVFLALLDKKTFNYNDFNVIAGRPYTYEVLGINEFGEGNRGAAIGFQVPDGVVTGWVQTPSGKPVPDAFVALTPLQGFSAGFGPSAGAVAKADTSTKNLLPATNGAWTLTFWIKTTSAAANGGLLSFDSNLYVRPLASAGGHEGIEVAQTAGGSALLSAQFPDSTKNAWHHVTLSVEAGGKGRLFIDGTLAGIAELPAPATATELRLGARTGASGSWEGRLDELRIYHHLLDELDLGEVMMGTASSQTPNLAYYWKMDEELGTGSFDVIGRNKLYFCGAQFNTDRPHVRTMGKTNQEGFYRIESASYGTGTTFLAEPMKNFYLHRALKFVPGEGDYATLPDFSLTPKSTLELWVNNSDPAGDQCLLAKKWGNNEFRLFLRQIGLESNVFVYLNGQDHNLGVLGMGYQHLALSIDSSTVRAFKNGVPFGSPQVFAGFPGNFSDTTQNWMLGARPSGPGTQADHFDGLIDEIAVYDTTLSTAAVLGHFQNARDPQEKGLRVYFPLDEGSGKFLHNTGSLLLSDGTNEGAEWSSFAVRQKVTPHEFSPSTRQVTLNPSVTSVDQVDFTDRSTVPVTGYVRYKNTDCFAQKVEILINGDSYSPKIFTDSTGKFEIDFDPGFTGRLTPKFEDHQFIPAFWEVTNVVSPIVGILFNDITTRTVSGQIAGGDCKKSIIKAPPGQGQGTVCTITLRSTDGCLERHITLNNQEGNYTFADVPPLEELTLAITEHSDPDIKSAFQTQGGATLDLAKTDTVVNFTYYAPPEVEIASGLDTIPGCTPSVIVLNQSDPVTLKIKLKEQYEEILGAGMNVIDDGVCYLDTANFEILNGFADINEDTTMSGGSLIYQFRVGGPNPSPPYLKTLQVVGTSVAGRTGSLLKQAIVTGILQKGSTFTTKLPERPMLILRDPPGDASYSYLLKDSTICQTMSYEEDHQIGGGIGAEVHLGGDVTIVTAPVGVGTIENAGPIVDFEAIAVGYALFGDGNSMQTCMTFSSNIATSDGSDYVGEDADLYMGMAMDIKFGLADRVSFDTCTAAVTSVINVEPGNQPTTFVYSQAYIENYLRPYLRAIANDPMTVDSIKQQSMKSDTLWGNIIAYNKGLKEKSALKRHISFDATTSIEFSETSTTERSDWSHTGGGLDGEITTHLGFQFQKVGASAIGKFITSNTWVHGSGDGTTTNVTSGYVLADDDANDAFSLDVLMDSVYNTPVFKLFSGQSSCPWEEGTAHREWPNLQLAQGTGYIAENVPAHEPAVFELELGNLSATNEDMTYSLSAVPGSNPHGAVIQVNGTTLNGNPVQYFLPHGESTHITLTIERGPLEYEYDSLQIALYSQCEYDADLSLGTAPDSVYFSRLYLGAHFIRPCSEVNINVPEQNWVVINDDTIQPGTQRRITVSGYDRNSKDFQLIRVQYRRANGDGTWINITGPNGAERYNPNWSGSGQTDTLEPGFTQFLWETAGLGDGPYEIHAWAVCTGDAADKPGFSEIIEGRIDREPPSLVGVPQPSDGVYQVGDEISFTFNQHVNCDKLIKAAGSPVVKNNVGLFDATTDSLIDIAVTCFENKIVLDPSFDNKVYENRILRAELHDIEDLTGNKGSAYTWEFYVDRNELAWLTDSIGMTKYEDNIQSVVARIHNRGGYPAPFKIKDLPDWVRVVPDTGVLAANEIRDIRFEVDSSLAFGHWTDSITLHTVIGQNPFFMGGDERLPLGVRVICRPPDWQLYAGIYQNSMNLVLELDIEGAVSRDVEDIVAAYIDDELRGRSYVQYVPQVDKWLAYLTVYGEPNDTGKPIRLDIWDASACLRYSPAEEIFLFEHDHVIGIPDAPQVIHTTSLVLREIPVGYGWNWLSFNLAFPNDSMHVVLAPMQNPYVIRNQTELSVFDYDLFAWLGTLTNLNNSTMYVYGNLADEMLPMMGHVIDPADMPLPLVQGWNWISYIPNYALPVNEALKTVNAQYGDLIKSQTGFAQYLDAQSGWVGNLKFMAPPNGYQIRVADSASILLYPPPVNTHLKGTPALAESRGENPPSAPYWTVNPAQYEFSMTLIGMLADTSGNATTGTMELGAFAGNEVRGSAQAIYVAPLQAHLFFLTMYANSSGELLHFKLYDSDNGQVRELAEEMNFVSNLHQGEVQDPVPFTLKTVGLTEPTAALYLEVQPNPFTDATTIFFNSGQHRDVRLLITDVAGRLVLQQDIVAVPGMNSLRWNTGSVQAGMYFIRLETPEGAVVRKILRQ